MPSETKFVLKSKTIWGVIIAAVPTILAQFGVDVGSTELINGWANEIIEAFGSLLAIYGRFVADTAVHVKE